MVLRKAECDVVGEGVVAEKEFQAGLGGTRVHKVRALPSHDVACTFCEHGLVAHLIHKFTDGVVINELRIAESGGLYAEEFLDLGGVLCHLLLELGVRAKRCKGVIVGFGQKLYAAGGGKGLEAVNYLRSEPLELVQGAAGDGVSDLELPLVCID